MNTGSAVNLAIRNITFTAGIKASQWTPEMSYALCRILVTENIFDGTAMIGFLRKKVFESADSSRPDGYEIVHSNYGWIRSTRGVIFDPYSLISNEELNYLSEPESNAVYFSGLDTTIIEAKDLPQHYISDELFPVKRGLHKQVLGRLLERKVEVSGLTMTEAAYIANLPLAKLERNSKLVYEFLISNGLSKLIPLNNVAVAYPLMAKKVPEAFSSNI